MLARFSLVLGLASGALSPSGVEAQQAPSYEYEDDESGGTNWFWVEGAIGYGHSLLVTISEDNFIPELRGLDEGAGGPDMTAAVGIQALIFTIGGRVNYAIQSEFNVGELLLDLSIRIPIIVVEPYFRIAAGYAWVSGLDAGVGGEADITGMAYEFGFGIDITAFPVIFGVAIDGAVLDLTREGVDCLVTSDCTLTDVDLAQSGNALGVLIRGTLHARYEF